ncbi:MAG: YggT family protein [Clostridiales bacterium]|nr:YggT family protein [Clostridiales bacterium]
MPLVRIAATFTNTTLAVLQLLLFARAILSWIPDMRGSRVSEFLISVTEPLIMPVRAVLSKFEALRGLPIDISFLVTYLLLAALQAAVSAAI